MTEVLHGGLLHGGMLLASGCGVGCSALLERRQRLTALAAALVMFAAMLDLGTGLLRVSAPSWAAVLVITAVVTTTTQMGLLSSSRTVALHRGIGAVVVAVALLAGPPMTAMPDASPHYAMADLGGGATGATLSSSGVTGSAAVLLYVVASVVLAVRHTRAARIPAPTARLDPPSRRVRTAGVLDLASMAVCVALSGITVLS